MHKICKNCDTSNSEYAHFCAKCGNSLQIDIPADSNIKERTSAEQTTEVVEKARGEAKKSKKEKRLHESQAKYCEGCGGKIHVTAKTCPCCGYVTKKSEEKTTNKTLAIVGLILNVMIFPGLGTAIGGNVGKGIGQMVLF